MKLSWVNNDFICKELYASFILERDSDYIKDLTNKHRLRLISGGHGQTGMDQLDKYGIKYNVVKTYSNGVRVGNIPDHKSRLKKSGTGQAWFPKSWTTKDIRRAGEQVAGLKGNRHMPDGKAFFGVYKGVRVGVIKTNGKIATVFPDISYFSGIVHQ